MGGEEGEVVGGDEGELVGGEEKEVVGGGWWEDEKSELMVWMVGG